MVKKFSPKIEIINHFDNLINEIDIDIDTCVDNYADERDLGQLLSNSEDNRRNFMRNNVENFKVEVFPAFNSSKQQSLDDLWTESTKVIDYLKQVGMKTIQELRNAQEETLLYYKVNSSRFNYELTNEKSIDELRSELFTERFYFQVNLKQSGKLLWVFNVFTFVTDFYMSPSNIDSLEKLINAEIDPFGRDSVFDYVTFEPIILIENEFHIRKSKPRLSFKKMVLIGLLYKYFVDNLFNFPNHVIRVCKQDVLNIQTIHSIFDFSGVNLTSSSTTDLSKLVNLNMLNGSVMNSESLKINIDGLTSLKSMFLGLSSTENNISIRNLNSLRNLSLKITCTIDQSIITKLLDQFQYIQQLFIVGDFSYFNLDSLVNLKLLSIDGFIKDNFNFDLLKNLCNQLKILKLSFNDIDEKTLFKLFDGHTFPNLKSFTLRYCNLKGLKKEFINRFPKLTQLFIKHCNLEEIEHDAFSNLKKLYCLDLSENRLKFIKKKTFFKLKNLQILDLSQNELKNLDANFIGVRSSVNIFLDSKKNETFYLYWHILDIYNKKYIKNAITDDIKQENK